MFLKDPLHSPMALCSCSGVFCHITACLLMTETRFHHLKLSCYLWALILCYLDSEWKLLSHVWLFRPHGLYSPWNSPGQNTGVGSLSLLQGIFPTQGLNPGLPNCRRILYQLSHKGSPRQIGRSSISALPSRPPPPPLPPGPEFQSVSFPHCWQ